MIHQQQLIPYSISVKDPPPPYVHYADPRLHIDEGESIHMAYHTRRICISTRIHRRFIPVFC
jgi:hypothetical protein